jgi:VWFA-related protein
MRHHHFAGLGTMILLLAWLCLNSTTGLAQSSTQLVLHYTEVTPTGDGTSYNIKLYFSALDGSGIPIRDLSRDSFTLLEDSQKVEIQDVGRTVDSLTNVVLVMDTSGSMVGASITDTKAATINFVSGLMRSSDQTAVLTFDNNIKTQISFTSDQKTITDGIDRIAATRDAGSCLYDAAYTAIQTISTLPTGSRAVILLTDGKDETPSHAICSAHTAEQVIELASSETTHTPIYTVSLGTGSDTAILQSIATQTGGLYLHSPGSSQLANIFQTLSDTLRSQYFITYQSVSVPGPHTLSVSLNQPDGTVKDTRTFFLPPQPTHLTFTAPQEGETIADHLKIAVSLTTKGEIVIERVAFLVNGVDVGSDDTKPYELELDATQFPAGALTVEAVAYDVNHTELARQTLHILRAEPESPVIGSTQIAPLPSETLPVEKNNPIVYTAVILSGLSILTIGLLLFILLRQQKQAKIVDITGDHDDTLPPMQGIPIYQKISEPHKAITPETESDVLGALTIEASDDDSLIGHRFEIRASLITLGRSADNDINFPNDKPVSRHHAEIYQISDKLYLREVESVDSTGTAKPPKYGTLLNEVPMGADPALLKTGDEIQLGKRVRLRFESYRRDVDAEALTYDDLTDPEDMDRTQEQEQ